jgi:hypothetical protein
MLISLAVDSLHANVYRTGKIDLKGWKKGDLERIQEDLDYYQIQLPEPLTVTPLCSSRHGAWAIAGAPNYDFNGWDVVTFDFLKENWQSFCEASTEGIKVLNSFTQSNPLPHVRDSSGSLAYVFTEDTGSGYLSSKGDSSACSLNEGDKVYFATYGKHQHLNPHSLPVKAMSRNLELGYLVLFVF